MNLHAAAGAAHLLLARRRANPLAHVRWLNPQARWLALRAKAKLLRAGNQICGKTWAGIAEVVWRCLGTHPHYGTKNPPIKVIVCNLNRQQSLAIQGKFADLISPDDLAPGCTYNSGTGWRANNPRITFRNGSTIRFVTDDQGPRAVAGATVDVVWIDEPCSPEMMRELRMRLIANGGDLLVTLTPINGPTAHIEEAVAKGELIEVHAPLCVDTMTYHGSTELRCLPDGTPCDDAYIRGRWEREHPIWAGIVLDGEWRAQSVGAFFSPVWDRSKHVAANPRFDGHSETYWRLGIDYALKDRAAGTIVTLCEVEPFRREDGSPSECIIIHDQVVHPGTATMEMLATAIRGMLQTNGKRWRDLSSIHGDNAVSGRFEFKSNLELSKRIARLENVSLSGLYPRIQGAKEKQMSRGSVRAGEAFIYEALAQRRLLVAARCVPMIEAFEGYVSGVSTDKFKDRQDSLRYALKPEIMGITNPHHVTIRIA